MSEIHRRPLWVVGVALSIGAGVIHFAFGPEHVAELGPLGFGFYVSGALQVGWAAMVGYLLVAPRGLVSTPAWRMLAKAGIAINAVILAAWAFSRVFGLPAGETPWTPEAIGRPDTIAGSLEGVLTLGLVGSVRSWTIGSGASRRWLAVSTAVALSAIVFGTVLAITPDATGQTEAHSHAAAQDPAAAALGWGQVGFGRR